ncbi:hypothetical protein NKG05_25530 [Oerskovia sp. M15]
MTEADALGALAEAWALAAALRDAPVEALPALLGAPRRAATSTGPDDDLPGGSCPSGCVGGSRPAAPGHDAHSVGRGARHGAYRDGREALRRRPHVPAGRAPAAAVADVGRCGLRGTVRPRRPELRPDGTLSVTSRTGVAPGGAFDVDELREIADRLQGTATAGTVGFGRAPRRVRLLMVRETGPSASTRSAER